MGYTCERCAKEFSEERSLSRHVKTVHMSENFICGLCNKNFSRRDSLNFHTKLVHKEIRRFQCEKCDKRFKRKQHLDKHKNVCSLCKDCGVQFQLISDFENHVCREIIETSAKKQKLEAIKESCDFTTMLCSEDSENPVFQLY